MITATAPLHMVTRFAPSPTGRLHVGHGWSALMAMDMARAAGGVFRLRIEDIDGTRSRPDHVAGIVEDLRWLGVEWDGDIVFQSDRLDRYDAALATLRAMGLLYPCFCTRADILASGSAPHGPQGPRYPGTCRRPDPAVAADRIARGHAHAWRIDMARAVARAGPLHWPSVPWETPPAPAAPVPCPADPLNHGDVVLARKDAPASYHLSCTLDDAAMGITHVLRGDDLRAATHVHRLLQALLGLPVPVYVHHPLLVDADGRRLAKRDGALALADLRARGIAGPAFADALRDMRFPVGIRPASA